MPGFEAPEAIDNDGNPVDIPPDPDAEDDLDEHGYDTTLSEQWTDRMQRFLENPTLLINSNRRTLAGRPSRRQRLS